MDYQRLLHAHLRVLADTTLAIPALTALLREKIAAKPALAKRSQERARKTGERHREARAKWAEQAREDWDASPITLPRLAQRGVGSHQERGLGADRRTRSRTGRASCGTSTSPTAIPASRSARRRRSAFRSASRSRTATPAGWWSTCSRTAT